MSSRNGTCDIDGRHGVTERVRTPRSRRTRLGAASAVTVLMALAAVSCGDGADDAADVAESGAVAGTESSAVGDSSAAGGDPVIGEQLSRSQGCAGCHGPDFGGGAGPEWTGLAGSQVTLADGSTVVADTAYLVRAIADPSAELVADYNLRMPANTLSDEEIAHIVAFIETLADG
jgi:mono/diheme cytochrome c family protein